MGKIDISRQQEPLKKAASFINEKSQQNTSIRTI